MANAWKELSKARIQAETDYNNIPESRLHLEALIKEKELQRRLNETPQGKRVKLLDRVNSEAVAIKERWESRVAVVLGVPAGGSLCLAIFKHIIAGGYIQSFESNFAAVVIGTGALVLPPALGWYTGHRIGTAQAEKFIAKERQKINS